MIYTKIRVFVIILFFILLFFFVGAVRHVFAADIIVRNTGFVSSNNILLKVSYDYFNNDPCLCSGSHIYTSDYVAVGPYDENPFQKSLCSLGCTEACLCPYHFSDVQWVESSSPYVLIYDFYDGAGDFTVRYCVSGKVVEGYIAKSQYLNYYLILTSDVSTKVCVDAFNPSWGIPSSSITKDTGRSLKKKRFKNSGWGGYERHP